MAREVVLNPDTGKPAFKTTTVNYEDAELEQLDTIVAQLQEEYNEAVTAEETAHERTEDVRGRLDDAKSEREAVSDLVEDPDGELDKGSDGDGGSVADEGSSEPAPDFVDSQTA